MPFYYGMGDLEGEKLSHFPRNQNEFKEIIIKNRGVYSGSD